MLGNVELNHETAPQVMETNSIHKFTYYVYIRTIVDLTGG